MSTPVAPVAPVTPVTPVTHTSNTAALLTWKDPVKTGKVFAGALATLVILKFVNLLNLFFRLGYLGLIASAATEYVSKLVTGEGLVSKYKPNVCAVSQKINQDVLPAVGNFVSTVLPEVQDIVFATDVETTLKTAGVAYIFYKLTSWFSLYTLTIITLILSFTAPAVYFANKKEIDAAVHKYGAIAKDKAFELRNIAHEKAAPHFDALVKKTGPVGSFISSKIPTRTAGSTVGAKKPFASKVEAAADKADTSEFNFEAPTTAKTTGASQFPTTAKTTGASQFPEVPSTLKEDVKVATGNAKTKLDGLIPEPSL